MNKKHYCLSGLLLALVVGAQAESTIVQWGEPGGSTNIVPAPARLGYVPATYTPGNESNPPIGDNYYPNASNRSPIFNATANSSPISQIPLEFPGAINQISIGTGGTNFQQMVVWENFLTNHTTLTSISLMLFPYGPGFTNGTYSFLMQKSTGKWYACAPVTLTKARYTDSSPMDPNKLTWHEFRPLTNGIGGIGVEAAVDMRGVQSVGYYSDIHGDKRYIGTFTAYFRAAADIPSSSENKQE